MSQGGNPFPGQFNPMPGVFPSQGGSTGGNPSFPFGNQMGGGFPPFNQGQQGFIPSPGPSMNSFWQPGASYNLGSSFQAANQSISQPRLPFLETLHFPDLSKLMNDPIHHDPSWPVVPTKLPSDIPKFEGKSGEDPQDHVTTFHLWCSSNSLNDDSIHLHLFQCTLTGGATKWYIELERVRYTMFGDLAMVFLNHFQLPVRYDVGTKLLANFEQDKAMHISITFRNGGDKELD
jgi:hypothetical protein